MTGARRNGFTLVELLVSLAITGAAAGMLVEALATGRSVAGRMEEHAAAGETVSAAQAILRDRIERLLADTDADKDKGSGGAARAVTEGTSARFTFIAPAALNRPGEGEQRYLLGLGAGGTLDLAAVDARAGASPARWRVDPLIGDVAAIDLSYYGPDPVDGLPRWQGEWRNRTDPPALVRVRLRFAGGDARHWPDLVVQPAATVSTACTLDFNTGTCRAS